MSSQGTFGGTFTSVTTGVFTDTCTRNPDPVFNVAGVGTRRVEPRNTPTMINAVFNFRNFWDGRANNVFNGMNPFGLARPNAADCSRCRPTVRGGGQRLRCFNSSLASQAVGPPLSAFEMSCDGRTFAKLGHKLFEACSRCRPRTRTSTTACSAPTAPFNLGLKGKYEDLVKSAFKPGVVEFDARRSTGSR